VQGKSRITSYYVIIYYIAHCASVRLGYLSEARVLHELTSSSESQFYSSSQGTLYLQAYKKHHNLTRKMVWERDYVKVAHTMEVKLVKFLQLLQSGNCNLLWCTKHLDALQRKKKCQLSWAYCGWERKPLPVRIIISKSYSATLCTCDITGHGCTITIPTIQFLIAACKNGGERPGLF